MGRLIYTRLDITYAVTMASPFMHDPHSSHLEAIYRVLHFLKPGKGSSFSNHSHLKMEFYIDAEWV